MHHAVMQSCGTTEGIMHHIKTVGKSGQISLGKAMAGMSFVMEELPSGDIMLRHAIVVPANQQWLHTPEMQAKLARFDEWTKTNRPRETNIDELETQVLCMG